MTRLIRLTPEAEHEIEGLAAHIAENDIDAALRFYEEIEQTFAKLSELPGMGAPRHFRNPRLVGIRMWPVSKFPERLIFYRPTSEGIEVIHVIHAALDYRRELGP
jgi:toxin ParE1/3/4